MRPAALRRIWLLNGLIGFYLAAGCGNSTRDVENYGPLPTVGLADPSQHGAGWGRADCLLCHNVANIHRDASSPVSGDAIAAGARAGGSASCLPCHGPNGITP
jgi:hypothetical protein